MIDRSFVEKIEEMAETKILTIGDQPYVTKPIHAVHPPMPDTLGVRTLTAVADYLKANVDRLDPTELIIHIADPENVILYEKLEEPSRKRNKYLWASPKLRKFLFGQYYGVEQFIISMQALFVQDEVTSQILKIVGNLTDSKVTQYCDDGVTQQVTAKTGIARVGDVPVPSPVILSPYRTFLEVDQPESRFIFRIQGREGVPPTCALFEADGGMWELEAIENIKGWLADKVPKEVTILA